MSEKKEGQAERLFEALNGVDPELLARSEKEKKTISFQKYAKTMKMVAACLALIVVGGTCWVTLHNGGKQDAASMADCEDAPIAVVDLRLATQPNAEGVKEDALKDSLADKQNGEAGYDGQTKGIPNQVVIAQKEDEDRIEKEAVEEIIKDYGETAFATNDDEAELDTETAGTGADYLTKISKSVKLQGVNPSYRGKVMLQGKAESFGQNEEKSLDVKVFYWLDGLDLRPAEDQTFEEYVSVQLFDEKGNAIKEIRVRDIYLQKSDLAGTFEIIDKEYNYDELRKALEARTQVEE